jgi:hypothetical protein
MSHVFPTQNGLKQGDALSPLLFKFTLENAIKEIKGNQEGLELKQRHQLLVYADDVDLLSQNLNATKER